LREEKEFIRLLKESFENYISEKCKIEFLELSKEIPIECLNELLKGLLILFYLHKKEMKDNFAIEFYHKSIQEYLTAEYFYLKMLNLPDDVEEAENTIWDLFSHRQISSEIREFLEQIIEKRREVDSERQNQFMEKVKKLLPFLLEKKFLLKLTDNRNTFNKAFWCFGNFWIFTNSVAPITDWKDETKQKFACMVKYTQACEETFVDVFLLKGIDLKGIYLSFTNLSNADLNGSNLNGANLSFADLGGANLSFADLSNADLNGSNLNGANLSFANLSNANLSNINLSFADLSGANLSFANLSNTNLIYTILENANLEGADLRGAIFDPEEIKKAKNWDKAIYDEDMKNELGLE